MLSDRPHYNKEYESLLLDVQLFVFDLSNVSLRSKISHHSTQCSGGNLKMLYCFTYLNNLKPIKSNTSVKYCFGISLKKNYSHWLLTFEELRHSKFNFTKLPTGRVPLHQRSASKLFMKDMKRKNTSCMNSSVLQKTKQTKNILCQYVKP